MTTEYVRSQPDFFAVGPASSPAAIDMGTGIWCSPGMSSSYLITTDDGRIVVNTGMWFEARTHKRNYDAVSSAPTRYIVLTQSHTDHTGRGETCRHGALRARGLHRPHPEPHRPHRWGRRVPRRRNAADRPVEHHRVPGRRRTH